MIGSAFAQDAASALADAQKAYVAGNWKDAAAAYEKACPMQPKENQPECLLWNVLALSQTGEAASFKKAGKRLDSLIQKVNPQEDIYADLMMTSAQFRLYLGKYDKAAEDLIHAIETSKPHHNVVLQKVCGAVKAKIHSEDLTERCESLKNPQVEQPKATETAAVKPAAEQAPAATAAPATQPVATQAPAQPASSAAAQTAATPAPAQPAPQPATTAQPIAEQPKAQSSSSVVAVQASSSSAAATPTAAPATTPVSATPAAPAPAVAPAKQEQATPAAPAQEYWVLQLGAFGVKDNATLLASTLKKRKIQANIVEQLRGERTLYLVQTGHFATKDEAVDYGAKQLAPLKVEFQPLLKK